MNEKEVAIEGMSATLVEDAADDVAAGAEVIAGGRSVATCESFAAVVTVVVVIA